MLQSFQRLLAVDPGFKPEGVATFEVLLTWSRYPEGGQREQFFEQARARLGSCPGCERSERSPIAVEWNEISVILHRRGGASAARQRTDGGKSRDYSRLFWSHGHEPRERARFRGGGRRGQSVRRYRQRDAGPAVFPRREFIGKRIKDGGDKDWRTIVGVVRDVRGFALEAQSRPQLYHPHLRDRTRWRW